MSTVTQCPTCSTRFRVTQDQLDAYHGMVRCGRCEAVFNAIEHLYDDGPSPQLDLPIMLDEAPEQPDLASEIAEAEAALMAAESFELPAAEQEPPKQDTDTSDDDEGFLATPKKKRTGWPWSLAGIVFLLVLLAQAAYFFRVELAARLPGLKPALITYCSLLGCQVTLPKDADLMSIDSSDLEADPDHANVITLTATLHNHAPYAQAYPNLELTLNDINDKPVARRTFRPTEYLPKGIDEKSGLAGSRELNVRVNLDTADLKPSGYRLLLFYPK
jgi:predicted Zn finger-like uncharacterized protein